MSESEQGPDRNAFVKAKAQHALWFKDRQLTTDRNTVGFRGRGVGGMAQTSTAWLDMRPQSLRLATAVHDGLVASDTDDRR